MLNNRKFQTIVNSKNNENQGEIKQIGEEKRKTQKEELKSYLKKKVECSTGEESFSKVDVLLFRYLDEEIKNEIDMNNEIEKGIIN